MPPSQLDRAGDKKNCGLEQCAYNLGDERDHGREYGQTDAGVPPLRICARCVYVVFCNRAPLCRRLVAGSGRLACTSTKVQPPGCRTGPRGPRAAFAQSRGRNKKRGNKKGVICNRDHAKISFGPQDTQTKSQHITRGKVPLSLFLCFAIPCPTGPPALLAPIYANKMIYAC